MKLADQLNQKYAIDQHVNFTQGKGNLPFITINTFKATATISLLGGQVLSYIPVKAQHDLLFVSNKAYFQTGKAIKGGIPICWPWFAAHPKDKTLPFHGLVRNQLWQIGSTEQCENGDVVITLIFKDTADTRQVWPYSFTLTQVITIGDQLGIELITTNTGSQPFHLTQALHTYFSVGNINAVQVTGLEDKTYLDKVDQFTEKKQTGPITVSREVDRIYQHTDKPLLICDKSWNRHIHITHAGSASSVVWNPWVDISQSSKDLQDNDYQQFICVETANAGEDIITVAANEDYSLSVEYRVDENIN